MLRIDVHVENVDPTPDLDYTVFSRLPLESSRSNDIYQVLSNDKIRFEPERVPFGVNRCEAFGRVVFIDISNSDCRARYVVVAPEEPKPSVCLSLAVVLGMDVKLEGKDPFNIQETLKELSEDDIDFVLCASRIADPRAIEKFIIQLILFWADN